MNHTNTEKPIHDPNSPDHGMRVHLNLKKAFNIINRSMNDNIYIPAYILAFSIVEDRLFAMYVVAKRVCEGAKEVKRDYRRSLLECARYLAKVGHLESEMIYRLTNEFNMRNKRFHGAMWRIDEFTQENTQSVIVLAKDILKARQKQKRKYGTGEDVTPNRPQQLKSHNNSTDARGKDVKNNG